MLLCKNCRLYFASTGADLLAKTPTHHGAFDMAFFRAVPNITVAAPMNEEELRNMMYTAQLDGMGTFSIRYPRGRGVMPDWKTPFSKLDPGKARCVSEGEDIAILSIGHIGNFVIEAVKTFKDKKISVAHYDMRFLKPLDEELLHDVCKKIYKGNYYRRWHCKRRFGKCYP